MRAVVDVKVIVAVELQLVEAQHEPLKDAMRLESDGAVEIPLVLRYQNGTVDFCVEIPHEVLFAHVGHLICERKAIVG